jgi:hypothetical protein
MKNEKSRVIFIFSYKRKILLGKEISCQLQNKVSLDGKINVHNFKNLKEKLTGFKVD